MSLRFMRYRNKSEKNLMKIQIISLVISVVNLNFLGPNQVFWEASIQAKFRKNIKK